VEEVIWNEIEPFEISETLLDLDRGSLDLDRRLDNPALEHRMLVRRELVVEALEGLPSREEERPSLVETREEVAYAREM
jgi:hypothetical protein